MRTPTSIRDCLRNNGVDKPGEWWDEMMPLFILLCNSEPLRNIEVKKIELYKPSKFNIIEFDEIDNYSKSSGIFYVVKKHELNEIVLKLSIEKMLQVVTDIRLPFSDRYSPEYFLSIDEVDKVISLNMNPVRNLHNNALVISEHCARNLNYFGSVDNAHQITVLYNIAKVYTSNKSSIDELLQLLKNEKFIYYYEYGIGIINLYFKKDYVPFVLELNETKLHNMIIEFEEVLQCH